MLPGNKLGSDSMKKKDLIIGLIRYRFSQNGTRLGMSVGEAVNMAEARMRNEGLFGFFAGPKLSATPEGGIVSIVETFFRLYIPQLRENPKFTKNQLSQIENDQKDHAIRQMIFSTIENHRSKFIPGSVEYPLHLKEYTAYRVDLETEALHRMQASEMGLDHETIHKMVDDAATFFKARLDQF
jgi:hypothetical protein